MSVDFPDISFIGPPISNYRFLQTLPLDLQEILQEVNGVVAYGGGLHIRGIVSSPSWHSLEEVCFGETAFYRSYKSVQASDIPFAQDSLGDQFIINSDGVFHLWAEVDELDLVASSLSDFINKVKQNPESVLSLSPLQSYQSSNGKLSPGELLNAYPPFCTQESANGVRLSAVPASEQLLFLEKLSQKMKNVPEGSQFQVKTN